MLEEYAKFVSISREYTATGKDITEALNTAIEYCINNDILRDFLKKYRMEVLGMLLDEFDAEKYERTIRGEGLEEGIERANRLTQILLEQNRTNDLTRAIHDKEYQEQLFQEFNL